VVDKKRVVFYTLVGAYQLSMLTDLFHTDCINRIFFRIVWALAAVIYPVISFWVYVALGNELTIAKAFTVCISHFLTSWLLAHEQETGDCAL
jgi:hypothetical protein